jgi:hypothetical protein
MTIEIKDAPNEKPFAIIEPPFNFNAPGVSRYAPEITGNILLKSLCLRLGWQDLSEKRLLDFGCGVRFARTIVNLGMEIKLYVGIDVNRASIRWLHANISQPNLKFYHFDIANEFYHPNGPSRGAAIFPRTDAHGDYDAACMFSVITHQAPEDARFIFSLLHGTVSSNGQMYFTAFLDETIAEYTEGNPDIPGSQSTYNPSFLCGVVESQGWKVLDIFKPINFQQFGFRCRKSL